jgi:DNA primase
LKGHIPDTKVEEIKNRANIVDLVSEYVTLKKAGRNFIGLCPFHKEKTPSFSVTPDRQMFYCFGCGEGGNAFSFLMKINQMTYAEAIRHLAKKTGVVIPERLTQQQKQEDSRREQLIRINEMAAAYYIRNLNLPSGKDALVYLKKREIRQDVVGAFRLGFAPSNWHHLRDFFEKEKVSLTLAEQAGLIIPGKDASPYDRFRGRLMFPVEDLNGRVIAFGGRLIGDGEPKYLNSPESDVYVKGRNLYALNRAKESIRKHGYAILVEGYFDLISLWNAGITHVVATLGTALTKDQIELIGRYATNVVVLFDPDEAGRKALARSLELFLAARLSARVLVLPEDLDPDDYVRAYGADRLLDLINRAPSLVDYYIDHVLGEGGDFEKDRDSLRKAVIFISQIENVIDRNLFVKRVSEKLGINQEILKNEISHALPRATRTGTVFHKARAVEIDRLELDFIHLLLMHPEKFSGLIGSNVLEYFTSADLKKFGKILFSAANGLTSIDAIETVSHLDPGPLREGLMKKFTEVQPFEEEKMLDRLITDIVRQIRRRWYKEKHRMLKMNIVKAQEAGDVELCNQYLVEKERLLKEERVQGV